MRIGIDVRLAGGKNGIGRYIADFVEALERLECGDEFVLFGTAEGCPLETALRYHRLTANFGMYYGVGLRRAAHAERIDSFLAMSMFCPLRMPCRTATVVYDTYTLKLHEWLPLSDMRSLSARVQRFKADLRLLTLRGSDAIVCISECTKNDLAFARDLYDRATVIYPDASPKFQPAAGAPLDRDDSILYVGAFNRQKGLEPLVAAHARFVRTSGRNTRLTLAGRPTWPQIDLTGTIARNGCAHLVDVIERPSDDVLLDLYRRCSVFAYLSYYEGFGLPALEAIRCGAATVVSDRSSLREIVPFDELRADPTSIDDITRKLHFAIDHREDVSSRERVYCRKFCWAESALAVREVLRGGRRRIAAA